MVRSGGLVGPVVSTASIFGRGRRQRKVRRRRKKRGKKKLVSLVISGVHKRRRKRRRKKRFVLVVFINLAKKVFLILRIFLKKMFFLNIFR
jgi:hypothetical protein